MDTADGTPVSFDELSAVNAAATGKRLSPRTLGRVLRVMEDNRMTLVRFRDQEWGSLYRYVPDVAFREDLRLSKIDGADAMRGAIVEEPPEVRPRQS
jgi:hypothetical protein